jgi:acetyl esterase/lipase
VPSLRARLLRLFFRIAIRREMAAHGATEAEYVATARRVFEMGAARNLRVPRDMRIVPVDDGGVRGEWVLERDATSVERAILYAHGGAYVACRPLGYRTFAAELARRTHAAVFVLDYRRAPETRYPGALDDALAAYDALRRRLEPDAIALAGDSAGGNLALATLLALRRRGLARPVAAVVTFSPWTDLTGSGASNVTNAASDDLLAATAADPARIYAGDARLDDPLVSPLFGDYAGAPPLLVFASTIEVLRDDAVRLVERATAAGTDATLVLEPGMPHVWPVFTPFLPEAGPALARTAAFLDRCWTQKTPNQPITTGGPR